jgi:hypothetical protein
MFWSTRSVTFTHSEHAGRPENKAFSNRAEGFVAFFTDPNPPRVIAIGINSRTRFVLKGKYRPST